MKNLVMRGIRRLLRNSNSVVLSYYGQEEVISKIHKVFAEVRPMAGTVGAELNEAYQIYRAVENTAKIAGELAEVGTFTGSTARVICEAKGNRKLHLFDTFEGLPVPGDIDNRFQQGAYAASLEMVAPQFKQYPNVELHKGMFPMTGAALQDTMFSFVYLDVDLYKSTKDALEFFYPRLSQGAVLMSHDYVQAPGVRAAFDEFFRDKPEPLILPSGSQVLISKITAPKG